MTSSLRSLALVGAIALALPTACTAQQPDTVAPLPVPSTAPPSLPMVTGLPDFTNLVKQVGPAVVNITAEVPRRAGPLAQGPGGQEVPEIFRRFFGEDMPFPGGPGMPGGPEAPPGVSQGTGFLISDDGYILTNHHVVAGASTINVRLSDRREYKATLVGSDEASDVALLRIEGKDLPALRTATQGVQPGQWVVAIGSPFGFEHSVTAGIVSAVGRANPYANQQYVPFIQTDVAINRGNSGGPLLNTRGEVVGINSQIFSNSGGYQGVSFAIPVDLAVSVVNQLKSTGRVARGQLGVAVQGLTAEDARALGLQAARGALVNDVLAGGAAAKAGLQRGDVIVAVNGRAVDASTDLPPIVGVLPPGSRATVTVVRDGDRVDVPVVLDELAVAGATPAAPREAADQAGPATADALGLGLQDLSAAERQRLGLVRGEGVRIVRVIGPGARAAGLQPGDVVLQVGRTPVDSVGAMSKAVAAVPRGQPVMLLVRRGTATQFVTVDRSAD